MNPEKTRGPESTEPEPEAAPARERRYEAPRILSKRSVERVTLLSGYGLGSGSGIGGQ